MTVADLLTCCRMLPELPAGASEAYTREADRLLARVYEQLEARADIRELIGRNPVELLRDKQRGHLEFMATVFNLSSWELLVQTVPWIYRTYGARNFSADYFLRELDVWQTAIRDCLEPSPAREAILAVYSWLTEHHEDLLKLSRSAAEQALSVPHEINAMQQAFLALLLQGDSQGCLRLVDQSVHTPAELKSFYLDVVWPSMHRIGQLWEANQISVAEEHLATAIVGRVMAMLYPRFARFTVTRGRAVVSAGPNEFHEIGARMVADFLELDGWDVAYLGANTPAPELLALLKQQRPFLLALSVATVFNIERARQVIQLIRDTPETQGLRVLVGGLALANLPGLWQDIGADGYAADAQSAADACTAWWTGATA